MVPITTVMTLVQSFLADWYGLQIRTHRCKVHETGESDDPRIHGIYYMAAVELEEHPALDTWPSERRIVRRTNQNTFG